ncbi:MULTISPECIES: hypothetical protein [unclassified Thioalkalivibrio]|uniref:hypothetical protein n=1 Tax=unclassified Thioalkalivibrio TaxID=2621013 RepID=UPI00035D88D6|nr:MULTISPECIES: hypothetical protein [unclassified Thioalkalivibrio]
MDQQQINQRCVELFNSPRVQTKMWSPRMFWEVGRHLNVTSDQLTDPKVDVAELEVMLSAAAYEPSQCADEVNQRESGRADFIRRAVQSGQRPFLRRAD